MAKNFPLERKYEWSNTMFWNHYLIYPDYYNHHKNKIIIHHTAVDYKPDWTIDDVKKEIQHIYKYHTINRDFGDIGYNFLIDQMWNIYEWRAGWEWAVWMHATSNNVTSIWISLMWNFQYDTPTVEQMKSLVNLVTAIAKYYHIDPQGYSYTFSTNNDEEPYVVAEKNPNIMWHKHVKATSCPGSNLEKFLPKIRDEVLRRMKKGITWNVDLPEDRTKELKKTSSSKVSTQTNISKSNSIVVWDFPERLSKLKNDNPQILQNALQATKNNYKWNLTKATKQISKIEKKYTINDVKKLVNQNISVYYMSYQLIMIVSKSYVMWSAFLILMA